MTILRTTPTPAAFGQAVRERFGDVIRDAAGTDGRLTRAEAARIKERSDPEWIVSDNAVGYLEATGQKTVSAEKLIGKIADYAERSARSVAGENQKLSLLEARALPADLSAEFFFLRGKGLPERVSPEELATAVRAIVSAALDDGSMTKLPGPPWQVRGKRPLIEHIPHPASGARAIVYLAEDRIYVSRAASAGAPGIGLVGWYDAGPLPPSLRS